MKTHLTQSNCKPSKCTFPKHADSTSLLFISIKKLLVQKLGISYVSGPRLRNLNPVNSSLFVCSLLLCLPQMTWKS